MKRFISAFLVWAMLLSMLPATALAERYESLAGEKATAAAQDDLEKEDSKEDPEPAENGGFPEYVTVLPEGTEYRFSADEKTIYFSQLDRKIAAGDTFVLYIGQFPAAYVAENVVSQGNEIAIDVTKAPETVYDNVPIDMVLDLQNSIITPNAEAGVSSSVDGNVVSFSTPEYDIEGEGKISLELSNFRLENPQNGSPSLSIDYEFEVSGDFTVELEDLEFGTIRFLGIGTIDFSFLLKATANITMVKTGTFRFLLDADDSEPGTITEEGTQRIGTEFSGEGELKIGLQVAVGVDLFVSEASILTGTTGVAGKFVSEEAPNPDDPLVKHQHTDIFCYFFLTIGAFNTTKGVNLPIHAQRDCDLNCGEPEKKIEYTFEEAAGDQKIFEVKTDALEELMEMLPRMLCGNQTITSYTELEKDCSVEAGSTLTIAEGQTLEVHGNMEQRGVVELASSAVLIVHGDYKHDGGTLTLGEGAALIVDGDYTINAPAKPKLDGKLKLEYTFGGQVEIEDGEGTEIEDVGGGDHYEVSFNLLKDTVLKMMPGADLIVSGSLYHLGGTIIGGNYKDKCTIQVGQEGAATKSVFFQSEGSLEMNSGYDILVYGNFEVSGGTVELKDNADTSIGRLQVTGDYRNSDEAEVKIRCDVMVGGNVILSEEAELTHNIHTMTVGGDFAQSGESVFNESNNATLYFMSGCTHKVEFATPENCNLGTVICKTPQKDKLEVTNGMPAFYFGSDVDIVGDLRLVRGSDILGYMLFKGNSLTVRGDLILDGAYLGDPSGAGEAVKITTDGNFVIADGHIEARNGSVINVGGDFRMVGYDVAAKAMNTSEPSTGGFYADDTAMTVGGTVDIYCNISSGKGGFEFVQGSDAAILSVKGDMLQRDYADSDPQYAPVILLNSWNLIFNGAGQPQTVSFETEPQIRTAFGTHPVVINRNPAGLIWGSNTEKLKALLEEETESTLAIVSQPVSAQVQPGEVAAATVVAEGDGLTYTWYLRNPGQTKFYKSAITKSVYSFIMEEKYSGRQVYCEVTDAYGNHLKTDTVTLSMKTNLAITAQPKSVVVPEGDPVRISLTATGDGLTYKWYYKNPGASRFQLTTAVTGDTYTVSSMTASRSGRQIYCVITDRHGESVTSDTVTITMAKPLSITAQPKSVAVVSGAKAAVTVKAEGEGLTYTWYLSNPGQTKFYKSSVKSSTYSVTMSEANNGRRVYCVVADTYGNTLKSDIVTLSMKTALVITQQPKSICVAEGETAKVSFAVSGEGLTYKWYYRNPAASKFSLTDAFTGNTYSVTMTAARDGRQLYCQVTDKYGESVTTDTVTISMVKPESVAIVTQPKSVTVAEGEIAKVTVQATGDGLTYRWYYKNVGDSKYTYTSSFTGNYYKVTMNSARDGRRVLCKIYDQYGNMVQTNSVTLNMK